MNNDVDMTASVLDENISEEEILFCFSKLKNNKTCGLDGIANEYIKATQSRMLPIYLKLFNLIYETGLIPKTWTIGAIRPIYKNKGDPHNPENYRPITIVSCLGKLFTIILNNRLNKYNSCMSKQRKY